MKYIEVKTDGDQRAFIPLDQIVSVTDEGYQGRAVIYLTGSVDKGARMETGEAYLDVTSKIIKA